MGMMDDCRAMPDGELEKSLRFLAHHEKRGVARLLAHLAVFDERQLSMKSAGRSLYEYCTRELGYDEGDAFRRIRGARVARNYPIALDLVENGKLTLTSLVLLHPILKPENYRDWFKKAEGQTRRRLETLIASIHPEQARPDSLRRLPSGQPVLVPFPSEQAVDALALSEDARGSGAPGGPGMDAASGGSASLGAAGDPAASAPPSQPQSAEWAAIPAGVPVAGRFWQEIAPISADRVRVGFDAAAILLRLIERARRILRHKFPEGRLEDVMREVLETFLEVRDPQRRLGLRTPPMRRPPLVASGERDEGRLATRFLRAYAAGRYIPAKVKSAVWARDQGRCAWRFEDGNVCGGLDFLEFDHIVPYAKGGRSEYRNLRLLCRAHNQLAAELAFPRPEGSRRSP